jgi:hypothetical protein
MQLNKLQVVILCGGKGTRIRNFKKNTSKPLIKINKKTILERIIRVYSNQGFKNFLILTGYTSYTYKIQCILLVILVLFNVFDLDGSKGLQFKELILTFKSLIRGFCIIIFRKIQS